MEVNVYSATGSVVKKINLPEAVFGVPMHDHVLHTAIKAYLANQRQGTHATKTKANVSGGGKKPFKQKGTGSARQGSSRSPLMPGGGKAHGPQPRDYRQKLNRQVKCLALKVALSEKVRSGTFRVVNDFGVERFSTKHMISVLGAIKAEKALVCDERKDDLLIKSTRNIHGCGVLPSSQINAFDVIKFRNFVVSETALKSLQERLSEGGHE